MTKSIARTRFAAIVNPVSGRRNMLHIVRETRDLIQRAGGKLSIHVSERGGHAVELAAGLDETVEAVLVVGGDGTVSEVLRGLDLRRIPFLVVRTGTENLIARELNMPTDPERIARTLLRGRAVSFDLATLNGKRFVALAGVGFDAECVLRLVEKRKGHITHLSYVAPIWRTFWRHRFPRLIVELHGERVFDGRGFLMLGVIARYARNLRILRDARWDDGLLDVAIFPCASRTRLMTHALRVLLRRHVGRGGVIYRRCRSVTIQSPDAAVPVEVDGDAAGTLPACFDSRPAAARFLRM